MIKISLKKVHKEKKKRERKDKIVSGEKSYHHCVSSGDT